MPFPAFRPSLRDLGSWLFPRAPELAPASPRYQIARIRFYPIRCVNCGHPFEHDDVVVHPSEERGGIRAGAHARCAIVLETDQGLTWIDGSKADPRPPRPVLLTMTLEAWRSFQDANIMRTIRATKGTSP